MYPRLPTMLFRVIRDALLPDDVNFDLTGILQIFLDLFGNIVCHDDHLVVRDLVRLDHDAHLAPRLNGVAGLDALEVAGNLFEPLEPLDVVFDVLAPRTGTSRGNGAIGVCASTSPWCASIALIISLLSR